MPSYSIEPHLSPAEFISVLNNSTLGERRPVDDPDRIAKMLAHADLIVTARVDGTLVGVARSVSDFVYCTYLSDLAVDQAFQHQGIGKELIRRTKMETPDAKLILLSAPKAVDYYPKIGMTRHEQCFMLDDHHSIIGSFRS
jgi:GNAT superfamily N-acetyltransferase